jgi:hypothetical protein
LNRAGEALAESGEGFVAEGAGEVKEDEAGAAELAQEGDLLDDLGGSRRDSSAVTPMPGKMRRRAG